MATMPVEYQNLLGAYKKRLTEEELPQATRQLYAQQQRQGFFGSPVATEGMTGLQSKFLTAIGEKEGELGMRAADIGQQERMTREGWAGEESRFGRQLGLQESQFARGLEEASRERQFRAEQARLEREAARKAQRTAGLQKLIPAL